MTDETEPSGERYIPTLMTADVAVEHWHRYALAARFVAGKRVLDIASGEGYGSLLLAETAATVLGMDIDAETVAKARRRYIRDNLSFAEGSAAVMPLPDASVDVVVSFETLEHHDQHEEMMREIRRVLAPGGLCIISTPDRVIYSERTGYRNPFHVRELSAPEFGNLVARHFCNTAILGQKYLHGSLLTGTGGDFLAFEQENFGVPPRPGAFEPKYLLALASDASLPAIPFSVLEEDSNDREVARLNRLIREVVEQLEAVIVERDAYKAAVETWLSAHDDQKRVIAGLQERMTEVIAERDACKARR